jgi:large subunit ribosomal protein L3
MSKENTEIFGKKVGMTQVYSEDNKLVPVTVIEAGPCPITQLKTEESDGYTAVQFAFSAQKEQRLTAPKKGHFKKAEIDPHHYIAEYRVADVSDKNIGDILKVTEFGEGEAVDVIARTKGRGFQGVVKRYGFAGGRATHGSMSHRRGGSYGHCQWPGEVAKGKKMPGHMGTNSVTMQNLVVVKVIEDKNLILVKGSIPGANGSVVRIRRAKKGKK